MILSFADDATGALEVGAQFVTRGVQAKIWFGAEPPGPQSVAPGGALVIDTETRHLAPEDAYSSVHRFVITNSVMFSRRPIPHCGVT